MGKRSKGLPEENYEQLRRRLPLRSRIALDIMVDTGLRISDVLAIRTADLRAAIRITERKNGYSHTVRLSRRTLREARQYAKKHGCDFIIPYTRSTIWRDMRRACDQLGLPGVSLHGCRKLYARRLYRSGYDILAVQQIMGHKSPSATVFYLFDV